MYRFLLSRRWAGMFVFVVVVAVSCVLLSQWQWHRREQRLAANYLIESNYNRTPAPLSAVFGSGELATSKTWMPVRLEGEYVPAGTLLVRNRPMDSVAGFEVLVPFRDHSGRVLLVDRGFIPTSNNGSSASPVPAPPRGDHVVVVARAQPPESANGQVPVAGEAYRIRPAELAAAVATRSHGQIAARDVVGGGYGLIASEKPAPSSAPTPLPEPELDEGPHLSYAIQWIFFGLVAISWFVILVRRGAEEEAEARAQESEAPSSAHEESEVPLAVPPSGDAGAGDVPSATPETGAGTGPNEPDHRAPAASRGPARRGWRSRRRGPSDEEAEDALIDEAERAGSGSSRN